MTQKVLDESGRVHSFPDDATPDQIAGAMRRVPSKGIAGDVEVLGTGVRQGLQGVVGIPHELARSSADYRSRDYDLTKYGHTPEFDAEMRRRREKSQARINAAGQSGVERFPSASDVSRFVTERTGLTEVTPQNTRQRIVQAAGQGAGAGAVFGPMGIAGGSVGGLGSQSAAEAGAPPWLQTTIGVGLPLLTGRFGTPKPKGPSSAQLRQSADASYDAARAQAIVVPQSDMQTYIADLAAVKGFKPRIHPKTADLLKEMEEVAKTGPMSLDDVETYRQLLNDIRIGNDAGERRIAGLMIDRLDDNLAGSPFEAARAEFAKRRKTETVEGARYNAEINAAKSGSGGNINNAMRDQFAAILKSERKRRGFTKQEIQIMEGVVKGTTPANILRNIGKLSPEGNGLMQMLNLGGAMYSGGATLPLSAAGFVAKRGADAMTKRGVELLRDLVASGKIPASSLTPTVRQTLEAVIRAAGGAAGQTVE